MPPDPQDLLLGAVLWSVAGVVVLSVVIPPLFHLLGLTRYRIVVDDQPTDLEPGTDDPLYADLVRQLVALGFRPLGAFEERVRFFALHWLWVCRQRVFGSEKQRGFAVFYRLTAGEPVRMAYASCWTDQGLLWTGNHSEDAQELHADHVRWGKATNDLTELLRLHHEAAAKFGLGRHVASHSDVPLLAEVVEKHSRRVITGDKRLPLLFLAVPFLLGGIAPLAVLATIGAGSPAVPITIAAEGCAYWLIHVQAILGQIRRDRQAEAAKASREARQ